MGGEIKVVKKDGPGTLMRLYLLLKAPVDGIEQNCQVDFAKHNLVVSKKLFSLEYYLKTHVQFHYGTIKEQVLIYLKCECRCCLHYMAKWVD